MDAHAQSSAKKYPVAEQNAREALRRYVLTYGEYWSCTFGKQFTNTSKVFEQQVTFFRVTEQAGVKCALHQHNVW